MTTPQADARALLKVAPDGYVAERTRLAKEARAAKDRALAGAYQALKRPNLSMWAALAAADDASAVRAVVRATADLAKVQAGGSDAGAVSKASKVRREAVEALVAAAVKALAEFEKGAEARRAEIRGLVDQISRHPDLTDAWIDGTLRELPDDSWGFGAFAGLEVTTVSQPRASSQTASKKRPPASPVAVADERRPQAPTRTERVAKVRAARNDVAEAKRELAVTERRLDAARKALREAEKEVRAAEKEHESAARRTEAAAARLEASQAG